MSKPTPFSCCSIVLFLSLIVPNLYGQYSQNLRGIIKDKESQLPIRGVRIQLITLNPIAQTESAADGTFRFNAISLGRHTIRVTMLGYRDQLIPDIILTSAKEAIVYIELEEEAKSLKEIKVKSGGNPSKTNNELVTVSGRLFTTDQTNRFAGSLGDPSRMAANFAGVSGLGGQRNDIVIRGNSPMGLLWRLEGADIPNPNHFSSQGSTGGPISMLNNNTLGSSDFITGAFPADYGNCMSGVFDLKMRNGNNEKREYLGQVGFNGFEFGAEGPINKRKKSSYLVNYRYSTLGVFDKLGINLTFGGVPKYTDLSFRLNFPETRTGAWSLTGLGGLSNIALLDHKRDSGDLTLGQTYRNDIYNGTNMAVLILGHQIRINKYIYVRTSASLSYQKRYTQVDSIYNLNDKILRYGENTSYQNQRVHSFIHAKINSRHSLRAGVILGRIYTHLQDSFRNKSGNMQTLRQFDGSNYLIQGYLQWKYIVKQNLIWNAGLHAQHFAMTGETSLEPRAGLKFQLNSFQNITAGFGLHSQLQPLEVYYSQYLNPLTGSYIQNNRTLKFSKALHQVIGYEYMTASGVRLKAEIYYQYLYHIPVESQSKSAFSLLNFGADFANLPARDSLVNLGRGTNKGLEITLEKYFSRGYYWLLTASFFDSKYKGSNGIEFNTAFNGKYVVNGLAGYEYKCGKTKNNIFSLNIKSTIAGGRRYTPIDLDASQLAGEVRLNWNEAYALQFYPYFRADIRIGFKLNGRHVTQEWALDIQNAFNSKNPLQLSYNIRTGQLITEYQQGFLPIVLYRILF